MTGQFIEVRVSSIVDEQGLGVNDSGLVCRWAGAVVPEVGHEIGALGRMFRVESVRWLVDDIEDGHRIAELVQALVFVEEIDGWPPLKQAIDEWEGEDDGED